MLPLTSSLYVAGTLASTNSVLIDVGTGYYMEVRMQMLTLYRHMYETKAKSVHRSLI